MKLTKISDDFTPLHHGILFGIDTESDEPADIVVEIVESESGEVVATQRLRKVCQAEVNIAPYIERTKGRTPHTSHTSTFSEATTAKHHIRIGEAQSEAVITSVNLEPATTPSLLTTMPLARKIAYGEQDELLLAVGAGSQISAHITTNNEESLSLEYTSTSGMVIFTLATKDFDLWADRIEVELECNGKSLGTLRYTITPTYKGSTRLAWISEVGSIERYSFPAITSTSRKAERTLINAIASREVIRSRTELFLTLQSHYEPKATIASLSRIISSPKVWIERQNGAQEVAVTTSSLDTNLFNEPSAVTLTLSVESREEVVC